MEREKIAEYLLNAAHPDNGGKAAFFEALGFSRDNWPTLPLALRRLAETTKVSKSMESPHGWKYVVEGRLQGLTGKTGFPRTPTPRCWSAVDERVYRLYGLTADEIKLVEKNAK